MAFRLSLFFVLLSLIAFPYLSNGEISDGVAEKIRSINARGNHYGLVVSGKAELDVFLAKGAFQPYTDIAAIDISGRRFHVGMFRERRTILVMSGSGSVNPAQTTQLLLTHFRVRAVIHYGRSGSANPKNLRVGDVAIPRQFAHTGVWYWEKFGGDEGRFTREIANLTFSKFNVDKKVGNRLESVYFQPETVYSVKGKPQQGVAKFWFKADGELYARAGEIERGIKLDKCVAESHTCLPRQPMVKRVDRASSANFYVNNVGYRNFLQTELNIDSIDTATASIAMVCESENKPLLALRSITNYAGGSSIGNDVTVIKQLWTSHALATIGAIFEKLESSDSTIPLVNM